MYLSVQSVCHTICIFSVCLLGDHRELNIAESSRCSTWMHLQGLVFQSWRSFLGSERQTELLAERILHSFSVETAAHGFQFGSGVLFGDLYQRWTKQRLAESATSWNVFFFFRIKNMHHLFCDSFLDAPVQPSTLNPAGLITLTSELSMKLVLRSVTVALILYCLQDWLPHKALSFLSVRLFPAVNYPKT